MEWRTHDFLKIVFALRGEGVFHFEKSSQPFAAGDVIVVPPGTANRIEDDPASASSLYVCCMATSLLEFDPSLLGRFQIQCIQGGGHFTNRVASLMRRMVHVQEQGQDLSQRKPHSEAIHHASRNIAMVIEAMNLVQLVVQHNSRERTTESGAGGQSDASRHRSEIARYVASLETEFFEATTIDAAAASLGIPRRTFTKLFAEQTGKTWLQYVRSISIKHAGRRLRETDTPVTSVAFECGFNDLSTFYRQFKSQTGMSPAAYRSQQSDRLKI